MIRRAALTGALTAGLLLLGSAAASAYPEPLPDDYGTPSSSVTPARPSHPLGLSALRAATYRFHDLQRAEDAGYGLFTDAKGIACIDMPGMGGMGVHFVDKDLVGDPSEHVRRPEAMVYRLDAKGRLHLAAVEYVVVAADWDATHAQPPRLFGEDFALTAAGNRYGLPAYYSLHAWVWHHNPAGTFAMWNPRVSCPGA